MLVSIPAAAVVAGIVMITLALNGADSLVVDDYYKQGKTINQRIARDQAAADLGISGQVSADPAGMRLDLKAARELNAPVLNGRLVHVSDARQDATLTFSITSDGSYLATSPMPAAGIWRLHIEDPAGKWRLVSERWRADPGTGISLTPRPELSRQATEGSQQ